MVVPLLHWNLPPKVSSRHHLHYRTLPYTWSPRLGSWPRSRLRALPALTFSRQRRAHVVAAARRAHVVVAVTSTRGNAQMEIRSKHNYMRR